MARILKLLIATLLLVPATAMARPFESYDAVLEAFYQAGFENVLEAPGGDWGDVGLVLRKPGNEHALSIRNLDMQRVPVLDYLTQVNIWSLLEVQQDYAYSVGDVFLCYMSKASKQKNRFTRCLIFPMSIAEVVNKMSVQLVRKQISEPDNMPLVNTKAYNPQPK